MTVTVQDIVLEASSKNIVVSQQGHDADGNIGYVVFYGARLTADGFTFQEGDINNGIGDFYSYTKIYQSFYTTSAHPLTFDDENALTAGNLWITSTTGFSPISLEVDTYALNYPADTITFTGFGAGGFVARQTFDLNLTSGYQILQFDSSFAGLTRLTASGLAYSPRFVFDNFIAEVACFLQGTRILTERGDIPVENVRKGDVVITAPGTALPVVWTGHRHVDCQTHPRPEDVNPVRVRAGAFGPGLPHRDLLLSPDHAVFFNDMLIPVRHLINGLSIVREMAAEVTYYHIELSRHAVLLAEGLPCESYLDTGDRASFTNGRTLAQANPGLRRWVRESDGCAPLVLHGTGLEVARGHLLDQARTMGAAA